MTPPTTLPTARWSIQPAGGAWSSLASYGVIVESVDDAGMPSIVNVVQPYAILPGGEYERTSIGERVITLRCRVIGTPGSYDSLRRSRQALIAALRPGTLVGLRHTHNGVTREIRGYYEDGLRGGQTLGPGSELLALRLRCVDPFWRASSAISASLTHRTTLSTVNYIVQRSALNEWSLLGTGRPSPIGAILIARDGRVYVTATFDTVYVWNGATWSGLGSGLGGGVRRATALAEGPDGRIYVAGDFTTAGGGAANRIAVWNPASSTWAALGSGIAGGLGQVYNLAFDPNGVLYATGNFTTAGGGGAAGIARWDGSAWAAMGSGLTYLGSPSYGRALAMGRDGRLYVTGVFDDAGGVVVPMGAGDGVAAYDVTSGAWTALPLANPAIAVQNFGGPYLTIGADGLLYVLSCNAIAPALQRFNGSRWESLGAFAGTFTGGFGALPDGRILIFGAPTVSPHIAGVTWNDRVGGTFNGAAFASFPVDEAAGAAPFSGTCGAVTPAGLAVIGLSNTTATLRASGHTTVTLDGQAHDTPPTFVITGVGTLYEIANETTGRRLQFNGLPLLSGETVTVDCAARTITSNLRTDLARFLIGGSALATLALIPGNNQISMFHTGATVTATIAYTPRYLSYDA